MLMAKTHLYEDEKSADRRSDRERDQAQKAMPLQSTRIGDTAMFVYEQRWGAGALRMDRNVCVTRLQNASLREYSTSS
jgi:hypothetical protein